MNQWKLRLFTNGIVIVLNICLISVRLMTLGNFSLYYWLWGLPPIIISVLQIWFLWQSMKDTTNAVDASISSFIISLLTTFGFLFTALVINFPLIEFLNRESLRQIGGALAVIPYPFVIWALFCLNKSCTIIPEAHVVVANGIYRYSRHPLYVCYITWIVSNMMMFPSWPVITISALHFMLIVLRIKREEQLLLLSLPEYREYYLTTGLLGRRIKIKTNNNVL